MIYQTQKLYGKVTSQRKIKILPKENPVAHYKKHHDGKSLYAVLYEYVEPGCSTERIEQLLGPPVLTHDKEKLRSVTKKFVEKFPDMYPDGIKDMDTFVSYPIDGGSLNLQFRNGRLINHLPDEFREYKPNIVIKR